MKVNPHVPIAQLTQNTTLNSTQAAALSLLAAGMVED